MRKKIEDYIKISQNHPTSLGKLTNNIWRKAQIFPPKPSIDNLNLQAAIKLISWSRSSDILLSLMINDIRNTTTEDDGNWTKKKMWDKSLKIINFYNDHEGKRFI